MFNRLAVILITVFAAYSSASVTPSSRTPSTSAPSTTTSSTITDMTQVKPDDLPAVTRLVQHWFANSDLKFMSAAIQRDMVGSAEDWRYYYRWSLYFETVDTKDSWRFRSDLRDRVAKLLSSATPKYTGTVDKVTIVENVVATRINIILSPTPSTVLTFFK